MKITFFSHVDTVIVITDQNKEIFICNKMTRFQPLKLTKELFGKGKEQEFNEMQNIIKNQTEEEFRQYIINEFSKMGYKTYKQDDRIIPNL